MMVPALAAPCLATSPCSAASGGGAVIQARINQTPIDLPVVDKDDVRFGHITTAQGLSQTRVQQIVQDDHGFLWFGTQYGLNRYDGYNFRVFTHDTSRTDSLGGVYIFSLFKDREGQLWVGSDETLDRFDPQTETFVHFHLHRPLSEEGDATVIHISQDGQGQIWLATGSGLYALDPNTRKTRLFRHDPGDPLSLASNDVKSSLEDSTHRFWVATSSGLDELDRSTGRVRLHVPISKPVREFQVYEDDGLLWLAYASGGGAGLSSYDPKSNVLSNYLLKNPDLPGAAFTGVYAITRDHAGSLWIGTGGLGLLKLDRAGGRFLRYHHLATDPESISEDHVTALMEDAQGNMWVGMHSTEPNSFTLKRGLFQQVLRTLGPYSGGERLVSSVLRDSAGTLWFGSTGGLHRMDPQGAGGKFYATGQSSVSAGVVAIAQDATGDLWLGTVGQGLKRFNPRTATFKTYMHDPSDPNSLSDDVVADIRFDGSGTLWVATWNGLNRFDIAAETFSVYRPDPHRQTARFGRMAQDRDGTLWLAGDPGLSHFDPRTAQFAVAKHADGKPTISSDGVTFVFMDSDGQLWVGTRNGLDKRNADGSFSAFKESDGLGGNSVSCILEDDAARLWISTNKGLSRLDRKTREFTNYSAAAGLGDLTGWNACARSAGGELLFGGFSGLVSFDPTHMVESFSDASIRLTNLRINGLSVAVRPGAVLARALDYTDVIALAADQRTFSLEFASLSFASPESIRYRYKMEGLDGQWTEGGSDRRVVSYSGLPPGAYTFRAQAVVGSGIWTEPGAVLRIHILPPWFDTWWFRLLCMIGAIALAFWLFRLRLRLASKRVVLRMEERLAERTRIAQDLHDTVLQGLLSVSMQMAVANRKLQDSDPTKRDFTNLLASLRQVAEESRNAVRGLRDLTASPETLAGALARIPHDLVTDPGTSLRVRVEGEPRPLRRYVQEEIYLIAREAIANAFRHAKATQIEAEVRYSVAGLGILIRDNGVGIPAEVAMQGRAGHFGLRGMRERAERIEARLHLAGVRGEGTSVEFLVASSVAFETVQGMRIGTWLAQLRRTRRDRTAG